MKDRLFQKAERFCEVRGYSAGWVMPFAEFADDILREAWATYFIGDNTPFIPSTPPAQPKVGYYCELCGVSTCSCEHWHYDLVGMQAPECKSSRSQGTEEGKPQPVHAQTCAAEVPPATANTNIAWAHSAFVNSPASPASSAAPSERELLFEKTLEPLKAILEDLRPGTAGAVTTLMRNAYDLGAQAHRSMLDRYAETEHKLRKRITELEVAAPQNDRAQAVERLAKSIIMAAVPPAPQHNHPIIEGCPGCEWIPELDSATQAVGGSGASAPQQGKNCEKCSRSMTLVKPRPGESYWECENVGCGGASAPAQETK